MNWPYLLTQVLDMKIKMLYDTGGDICCLSIEIFKQINRKTLLPNQDLWTFKAAWQHHLHILGEIKVIFAIDDQSLQHQFFVIHYLTKPAILIIDFIEQHGLTYNPSHRTFKWKARKPNSSVDNVLKVTSCNETTPISIMTVGAKTVIQDRRHLDRSDHPTHISIGNCTWQPDFHNLTTGNPKQVNYLRQYNNIGLWPPKLPKIHPQKMKKNEAWWNKLMITQGKLNYPSLIIANKKKKRKKKALISLSPFQNLHNNPACNQYLIKDVNQCKGETRPSN